jgi:hypothetical protein
MQDAERTSFCQLKKPSHVSAIGVAAFKFDFSTTMTTLIIFPALNLNPLNTNSFVEYVDEHVHIERPSNVRTIPAESSTTASTPKSWVWGQSPGCSLPIVIFLTLLY